MKKDTGTSFESQESCRMIKIKFRKKENFSFELFAEDMVAKAIKNLTLDKASISHDI